MSFRLHTVTIGMLLAAVPAYCAVTTYSTRTAWEMDVTSYATIDFESLTTGSDGLAVFFDNGGYSRPADCTASLTAGQACFSNTGTPSWSVVNGYGPAPSTNTHFRLIEASQTMQITLAPGTRFGGMEIYTVSIHNRPFTVELFDSVSAGAPIATYSGNNPNFFGFASDNSIAMIRLSSGGFSEIYLDRVDFSGGAPASVDTPEATTLSYIGLGMLAIWLGSRKTVPSMRRGWLLRT